MTYAEAVSAVNKAAQGCDDDYVHDALAVLRRAEKVMEAVEKAIPEFLYGDAHGYISGSGASVLLAALAYRERKGPR